MLEMPPIFDLPIRVSDVCVSMIAFDQEARVGDIEILNPTLMIVL
jgi:hypothetical protein